mmetsp:Transcript_9333/g.18421  ORF Transcript_9333/g.18421 Transcript_9333/m.18421 type:complete len:660 (+) Transcript_9333:533-2512(+)|eukprot:CAMPEP_0171518120 /NCGR_PEP_ID=MMETSP0959-20130129/5088_1 /TAXON_ID=87120 /ORGANISM="Aurantiochytrium limacinum, Strain ATCCMYA-1381" /LENGTH=659 /DNA_ID=CAMNT_0012057251 /DNA_START=626 /DNA_END=2605 /DNA_ORIENTATION=-
MGQRLACGRSSLSTSSSASSASTSSFFPSSPSSSLLDPQSSHPPQNSAAFSSPSKVTSANASTNFKVLGHPDHTSTRPGHSPVPKVHASGEDLNVMQGNNEISMRGVGSGSRPLTQPGSTLATAVAEETGRLVSLRRRLAERRLLRAQERLRSDYRRLLIFIAALLVITSASSLIPTATQSASTAATSDGVIDVARLVPTKLLAILAPGSDLRVLELLPATFAIVVLATLLLKGPRKAEDDVVKDREEFWEDAEVDASLDRLRDLVAGYQGQGREDNCNYDQSQQGLNQQQINKRLPNVKAEKQETMFKRSSTTSTASTAKTTTVNGANGQSKDAVVDVKREGLEATLANKGNGRDEPLSEENVALVKELYDRVQDAFKSLLEKNPSEESFTTYETCRRYLVAREWKIQAAEDQLRGTVKWRIENDIGSKIFCDSPAARKNPWGWSMRMIGFSEKGNPVAYTVFSHANDRFNLEGSIQHLIALMESMRRVIHQRAMDGLEPNANQRQWVWVIDFHGFSLRDTNPRTGSQVNEVMAHYPEFLNCMVLLNAPSLFSGLYRIMCAIVDERVRQKVVFVTRTEAAEKLKERLGNEIADWIAAESQDNKDTAPLAKRGTPKKYWIAPTQQGAHDPRGTSTYVSGKYFIKSPGDAYEEDQAAQQK